MRPNPEVASKGSAGGALTTAPYLGGRTHGQWAGVASSKGVEWADERCSAAPAVDARPRVGAQTGALRSSSCAASGGWGSPVTTPLGDTPRGVCEQA